MASGEPSNVHRINNTVKAFGCSMSTFSHTVVSDERRLWIFVACSHRAQGSDIQCSGPIISNCYVNRPGCQVFVSASSAPLINEGHRTFAAVTFSHASLLCYRLVFLLPHLEVLVRLSSTEFRSLRSRCSTPGAWQLYVVSLPIASYWWYLRNPSASMVNFPLAEAQIVSLFVQSVISGVHATTFAICMWTCMHRSKRGWKPVNWPMLSIAVALFVIGTTDLAFNLYHVIIAFIYYTGPGGATGEFERISNWVNVIRSVWTFLQTLLADGTLIYRCWIIYTRNRWVVILPLITWFADAACAVAELYYTATLDQNTNLANARKVQPFLDGFVTLALANNIMTTGLIVYRIHRIHKQSARALASQTRVSTGSRIKLSEVNRILIESALLYTTTVAITLIVNLAGSNAVYPASDLVMEMAGIQFDLIMIRVSRGIAAEQVQTATETMQLQFELRKTASSYTRDVTTTQSAVDSAPVGWEGKNVPIMSSLVRNEDQSY